MVNNKLITNCRDTSRLVASDYPATFGRLASGLPLSDLEKEPKKEY